MSANETKKFYDFGVWPQTWKLRFLLPGEESSSVKILKV